MKPILQKLIYLLFALCVIFLSIKNAKAENSPQKDTDILKRANASYAAGDYLISLEYFNKIENKALLESEEYLLKLGTCYFNSANEKSKAISYFERVLANHPKSMGELYYYIGQSYQFNKKYTEAIAAYEKGIETLGKNRQDKKLRMEVINSISTCYLARDYDDRPMNIKVYNMGTSVNSAYPEYGSVLSADGGKIFFNALKPNPELKSNELFEMICSADLSTKVKTNVKPTKVEHLNNFRHEALLGFTDNGNKRFVYDEGDIYLSKMLKSGDWAIEKKLNLNINSMADETSLTLSSDGKTLYFASDRAGGLGGLDLYSSTLLANGNWGEAVNLGPTINSPEDEDAPFLTPDGKTLYFSSKGHLTMGGYDIFRINKENGHWTLPVNLGAPINSVANDNYFSLCGNGIGFISSDRKGGLGGLDIYKVVYEELNIQETEIKGMMYLSNYTPLNGKLKITDKLTGLTIAEPLVLNGVFNYKLAPGKKYIITAIAENYLPEVLELFVPYQQKSYVLYQNFKYANILNDKTILGQQVSMNYAFFDVEEFFETQQSVANIYEIENVYSQIDCPQQLFVQNKIHLIEKEINATANLLMVEQHEK